MGAMSFAKVTGAATSASAGRFAVDAAPARLDAHRFAFAISQHKHGGGGKEVHYRHSFVLSPEAGGTKLVRTTAGDGNPVIGFLAKPAIMKDGRTSLGNLKEKVEASA